MSPEEAYLRALLAAREKQKMFGSAGDILNAALASLRASGYVVVPVEPTAGMIDAFDIHPNIRTVLRAGIEAAPVFPPEVDRG